MKLECSIEKIKNTISQVERVTRRNLTLPVLNSILMIASGKSLKLRATNLSLGIEVEIPAKIEKEGVVAISGGVLSNIFSNIFDHDNVSMEGVGGNLLVKTKRSQIKLKGEPTDDFPTLPLVEGRKFEIDSKKLTEGIKSVYFSASPSDIKPEISSVYLYGDGDNLTFVSTDSFRLAEKKIKVKGLDEILGILIPFKNVSEILRVFGNENKTSSLVEVSFNKNQISFSSDGVYLTSRVIDGVFPDYRQIIPKASSTEATLLKEDLLNALKLSNVFSDKFNQITLTINPKEKVFELTSANQEVGENKTRLDAALSGEEIELSFNYRYFLDSLQSITTDSLTIKFDGPSRPIIIAPVSDTSFTALIMPMNR